MPTERQQEVLDNLPDHIQAEAGVGKSSQFPKWLIQARETTLGRTLDGLGITATFDNGNVTMGIDDVETLLNKARVFGYL